MPTANLILTHYATRYLQQLEKFVDQPQLFKRLWLVNSETKPLQRRQRLTLVRVCGILLSCMEAEYNNVGVCKNHGMEGITHKNLMGKYAKAYGESITKGRWYRAIEQLKDANCLTVKGALIIDRLNEGQEVTIRSIASMKTFTQAFFSMFKINDKKDVKESRKKCIADRIAKGLSNIWTGYHIFNRNKASYKAKMATYDDVPEAFDFDILLD